MKFIVKNKIENSSFFNSSLGIGKALSLVISKIKALFIINLPRINKMYLLDLLDAHLVHYNSPIGLTYAWSFGSLAGACLIIQMLSGIFLSMVRLIIKTNISKL